MGDSWRGSAYIWCTWLTGLLAGTEKCEWRAWYKAHHRFAKRPNDGGDLDTWKEDHDAMVERRVAEMLALGYSVSVEDDNSFLLKGRKGTLAGKPDIVGVRDGGALVVDEKSGKRLDKDAWQVRVYMFALPLTGFRPRLTGQVEYRDGVVPVPMISPQETAQIASVLQMASGELVPPHTPSVEECRFCEVAACQKRIVVQPKVGETSMF